MNRAPTAKRTARAAPSDPKFSRQFRRQLERKAKKAATRPGLRRRTMATLPLIKKEDRPTAFIHVRVIEPGVLSLHFTKGWRYGRAAV